MSTVDHSQGHTDPTTLPQWLVDAAVAYDRAVLGWMAAAYLAGVQVAQKCGPCGHSPEPIFPGAHPPTCTLAWGHKGGHTNGELTTWTNVEPAGETGPDLESRSNP